MNRQPQHYARPAGRVLARLQGRKLVRWTAKDDLGDHGWLITAKGRELLGQIRG